ncbi:MAG TPA: CBS domain-containing protein [Gaiella sp.]|jgi:CBS domain-containing protein
MEPVSAHASRDLLSVAPGTPLREVIERMAARNVGAALVIDGERLAGILTERDVLRAVADEIDLAAPVSTRMTHAPETIESSDSIDHAATLMIHGGFRHLPVVDGGVPVGILSIRDLVRVALVDTAPRGA